MKILVTGASGNVGRYVIQNLIQFNEEIIAAGTDVAKLLALYGVRVKCVEFDFTRTETFENALDGVDRIFLMRPPHLGSAEDLYPFLDYVSKLPIKLLSFLSLMGIEKNTIPPHYKIEKKIEQLGIPYAHIRPGFFMQNISGIHSNEIRENDEIFIPAGRSKASFIDAEDIGLAISTVLMEPQKYTNSKHTITGQQSLDYYEIANILSQVTGRKISYRNPNFLHYRNYYIKKRGLDSKYVDVTVALYFMTRLGSAKSITKDFYKLTGKQATLFKDFAQKNISAFIQ
jgi:uncharacterized protein YbjT (DUF2867 family)